jgi:hypothetical protein
MTYAKSATEAAKLWRRRKAVLPEFYQTDIPNQAKPGYRLQSPVPSVRATDIHLPDLRSSD